MTDSIKYVDQSAYCLRLNVIEGDIDYEQLYLLVTDQMQIGQTQIYSSIIGASHLVRLQIGKYVFNEIFACVDVTSNNRILLSGKLENLVKRKIVSNSSILDYEFEANLYNWEEGAKIANGIERKSQEMNMRALSNSIGLCYEFPGENDGKIPKTIVALKTERDDRVFTETVHSYPNEEKIVITNSKIQIKGGSI